ncbi:MAG: ferredoxin [Candidatus Omnitrophica bacterium CG11_big_fil_rev_8_21_14_0_20_64_10]|nr:MAG: ferredoxin [Candidatus Omnitrophica bacterium CG11_big_fil_rev_8_21_14_0_20_64_10]
MAKRLVHLIFPQKLIKEPVIFTMARKFEVIPNVRRAKVTETVGEMVLELDGAEAALEKGVAYLTQQGVKVEPIVGDIVE